MKASAQMLAIYFDQVHVGDAELQSRDNGMGVACGVFHPTVAYEHIRPSVVAASEARNLGERPEPLALEVRASDGHTIRTGFVQIDDFADVPVTPEVTIQFASREDFFQFAARSNSG